MLVPQETDFSRKLSPAAMVARGNPNRETIEDATASAAGGPSLVAFGCDFGDECEQPPPIGSTVPGGVYMTFQRLINMGEPWMLGAPEIEVHVHGPNSPSAPQFGADLACSGDRVAGIRGFNQDNVFWNGDALIFDQAQIDALAAIQPNGFNVSVWEDDSDQCQIKKEDFDLAARIKTVAAAVGGWAAVKAIASPYSQALAASTFVASVYSSLTFLWSNDDFLGTYVNASAVGLNYADANHVLYINGGQINGRAKLVLKAAR